MSLPLVLVPHPHVRIDANVLGGSPYVVGSRVPVRRLWAFYQGGATVEQLLRRFPQLEPATVFDALAFALDNEEVMEADLSREQEMLIRAGGRRPGRPRGSEQMVLPFVKIALGAGPRGERRRKPPK
ncbi:MAG TPA: DUF433 domain-containing protein [Polyangiaceae bacterium]